MTKRRSWKPNKREKFELIATFGVLVIFYFLSVAVLKSYNPNTSPWVYAMLPAWFNTIIAKGVMR